MKQSEAIKHLRVFMIALQRYRSMVLEELGPGSGELHATPEFLAKLQPWAFGLECPLPALEKVLARVERGNDLEPMNYYNFMTILSRFLPELKVAIAMLGIGRVEFPDKQPDIEIMLGWDPEDEEVVQATIKSH